MKLEHETTAEIVDVEATHLSKTAARILGPLKLSQWGAQLGNNGGAK